MEALNWTPLKEARTQVVCGATGRNKTSFWRKRCTRVSQTFPSPAEGLASPCWSILGVSTSKDAKTEHPSVLPNTHSAPSRHLQCHTGQCFTSSQQYCPSSRSSALEPFSCTHLRLMCSRRHTKSAHITVLAQQGPISTTGNCQAVSATSGER